tara:strand:+ start:20298 stop:20438 length:141 start_codon:yes stop_codon:yes gene_type:complete
VVTACPAFTIDALIVLVWFTDIIGNALAAIIHIPIQINCSFIFKIK